MCQPAEDVALALEALFAGFPDERELEELDRYPALKSPVVSFRQPDASHAALADLRYQRVCAHCLTARASADGRSPGTPLRQRAMFAQ